jgi:hypothetical protein
MNQHNTNNIYQVLNLQLNQDFLNYVKMQHLQIMNDFNHQLYLSFIKSF